MTEADIIANVEQRLAFELGAQHMTRIRAEVERDAARQVLAQIAEKQRNAADEADKATERAGAAPQN